MSKLDTLEKYNSKVRQELEHHISQIQKSIAKYDAEYAKSLEVVNTIKDSLIMLLKNVRTHPNDSNVTDAIVDFVVKSESCQ